MHIAWRWFDIQNLLYDQQYLFHTRERLHISDLLYDTETFLLYNNNMTLHKAEDVVDSQNVPLCFQSP